MKDRTWNYVFICLAVGAAAALFRFLLPSLLPFLLALLIAFFIDPVVNLLEQKGGLPRGVAAGLALFASIMLLIGLFLLAASRLVQEIWQLSKVLPSYYSSMVIEIEALLETFGTLPLPIRGALQAQGERLLLLLQGLLEWTIASVRQVPSALFSIVVTFIAAFFLSRDKDMIARFFLGLLPPSGRARMQMAKRELIASTLGLAKAALTLMGISTLLTIVGLLLARVQFAIVMGLVVGIVDLLPIVGPSAVFWPWIGYNLLFGSPWLALKLALVFAAVSFTRAMLEPRIVGARIGVHPLATLLSVYLGIRFFGAAGFIIGPLVAILVKCAVASGLINLSWEKPSP